MPEPLGVIRRAVAADEAAIRACVQAAYAHYVPRIGKPPAPMLADYADALCRHIVFVFVVDGVVAGVLVLVMEETCLLLDNIAVDPAFQQRGIGQQLMTWAEHEALARGYACLQLYTNVLMVENIAWYARLGFMETARREEVGYQRVYMEKALAI